MIFSMIEEGFHGCNDKLLQLIVKMKKDHGCGYNDYDIEMVLQLQMSLCFLPPSPALPGGA